MYCARAAAAPKGSATNSTATLTFQSLGSLLKNLFRSARHSLLPMDRVYTGRAAADAAQEMPRASGFPVGVPILDRARVRQRAEPRNISTTLGYVRETAALGENVDQPFGPLPTSLLAGDNAECDVEPARTV